MINQNLSNGLIFFVLTFVLIHKYNRDKDITDRRTLLLGSLMDYFYTCWAYTSILQLEELYNPVELRDQNEKINQKQAVIHAYLLAYYSRDVYINKFQPILSKFTDHFRKIHSTDPEDETSIDQIRSNMTEENNNLVKLIQKQRFFKYYVF